MRGAASHIRPLTGRAVLWMLIAFFGVIFAVNGTFAYLAIATWPGLSRTDSYQAGLHYNDTLADARRQARLGWKSGVAIDPDGALVVLIEDRDGNRIDDLDVTVSLVRAVSEAGETELELEPSQGGRYTGRLPPPIAGLWEVTIVALDEDGHRYRMTHEVFVNP